MITQELIFYIEKQKKKDIPKNFIVDRLLSVGWRLSDIEEGFNEVEKRISRNNLKDIPKDTRLEIFNSELPEGLHTQDKISKLDTVVENKINKKVWTPQNIPIKEIDLKTESSINTGIINQKGNNTDIEVVRSNENKLQGLNDIKNNILVNNNPETEKPKSFSVRDLPKSAMISSYNEDLISANKNKTEITRNKNRKINKISLIIFILIILLSAVWFFAAGFVDIKNINLLKKDSSIVLLNSVENLNNLSSYNSETNIDLSIKGPSIDEEKDISINVLGSINKGLESVFSDSFITIKGYFIDNYISTDVKNNGTEIFMSIPDLSSILSNYSIKDPLIIKANKQELNDTIRTLLKDISVYVDQINFFDLLSRGLPSYINKDNIVAYNELLSNSEIVKENEEMVKNFNTSHYSIKLNDKLSNEVLNKILENYLVGSEESNIKNKILNSISINSLDFWINNENNIFKYQITFSLPVSIFENSQNINNNLDNKIIIDWQTIYDNFNTQNNIIMPSDFINYDQFINLIKENDLKNNLASFSTLASDLFSLEGKYGSKSNTTGKCTESVSGSLFSVNGHSKDYSDKINEISELLKKLITDKENDAYCYSDTKAWSLSVKSEVDQQSYFYCVDSLGNDKKLEKPQSGVVCE